LSVDALKPGGAGMACAFDTGGLWSDKITLAKPLAPEEKRALLLRSAYEMDEYHPTMEQWLGEAYEPQALCVTPEARSRRCIPFRRYRLAITGDRGPGK
jgi:hypothetical protein